jgi:hypothetical protein
VAALYRYYQRTGNPTDLANFRAFGNLIWQWTFADGGIIMNPPRACPMLGMFLLALDSHPERLPYIYNMIQANYTFSLFTHVSGQDNREPGYMLLFSALGAMADPTNRSAYCSQVSTFAAEWTYLQTPAGLWPEKSTFYAYAVGGESPWRVFSVNQGLARAYDDLINPSICNNPTQAATIMTAIKASASFVYNAGFTTTNRGMFYDLNYADDGQDATNAGPGPGTVSATIGSNAVLGTGTSFLSSFTPNVSYIGINDNYGNTWTYVVTAVADNTHLTIAANYGAQQYVVAAAALVGSTGYVAGNATQPCPSYAPTCAVGIATTSSGTYYIAAPAPTNCNTTATYCWAGNGSTGPYINGNADNIMDAIWIMGWLYARTADPQWKTKGDELFSSVYGGPAGGPGYNYPGSPGPCGGPNCSGYGPSGSYINSLVACAQVNTVPCNPQSNYIVSGGAPYGNAFTFLAKPYGQGSGIGGADNYLAWRLGTDGKVFGGALFGGGVQ